MEHAGSLHVDGAKFVGEIKDFDVPILQVLEYLGIEREAGW